MVQKEGKSLGNKVVLAKIPREEYSRFQQYCDQNGETINASLRRLILREIDNPEPARIACKSVFEYNKDRDNFSWKVVPDDGENGRAIFGIDDNLPADSLEQLLEALIVAREKRNSFIRKNKNGSSVSFPTKLLR